MNAIPLADLEDRFHAHQQAQNHSPTAGCEEVGHGPGVETPGYPDEAPPALNTRRGRFGQSFRNPL